MSKYVGAIDQGTTSTRFMVFDHSGLEVAKHQLEHEQIYPQAGWVEHDPLEIWARTQDVIKGAMQKAGLDASQLVAIGVTNQRETTVVWNKQTGKPYYNAIVWQDTRTDRICNQLERDGLADLFRRKTGLPIATYFSGPKIKWILDNVEGVREAAERGDALFGNIDTWIIWNLTGGPNGGKHITDVTNASRTMLMNLETLDWDDELLRILGIPRQMLPEIRPSSDPSIYGMTAANGPFGAEIPVCGDLGDQQAATVGQTCFDVGEAKNTYGTGCFMLLNTGTEIVPSKSGLLTTVCYKFGDEPAVYALEGSIAITGALVQWLRDNLDFFDFSHHIEDYARTVEDNGGVYFVPAFSGLFAPYWRSDARGVIVGLTRYANKGHICRAALEATAYQTREVLDAMKADSGVDLAALKVDGGMVYNELLMQFQADILNVPVVRPQVAETTSLGAAYAAGLAVGFWSNLDDLRQNWQVDKTWTPAMDAEKREKLYRDWKRAVERTFGWVEQD
ncbi:glycerol kinase GlpK [Ardenticatena maritima]|uniref:Glycerol kinase n=1 Tax=Ardenticatena maritima TaxID=872965 RepID=A0A0P6Y397_9CHLR|nr:glycerol kinase GlpK [Ardenticatena maritima]KPL86352.1 glycerol kinase [Ardenticatena maritima]